MRFHLEDIRNDVMAWRETLAVEPAVLGNPAVSAIGPVACDGQVSFVRPGFLVDGGIQYEQTLHCDRCLAAFVVAVEDRVTMVAVEQTAETDLPEDLELQADDLDVVALEGDSIDTDPLVHQQMMLNVPMKPLCRDDCQGLCPSCGTPRREGCDCEEESDPRWSALAGLRDQLPEA